MTVDLLCGDVVDVFRDVRGLASIVADPPGGGSFMSLAFDHHKGGRDAWIRDIAPRFKVAREATERGAWGLFWSFPRTAHWTACALDDAGWDVVSCIEHVHGQGWPKGKSQLKPSKEIWWLVRWGGVTPLQIDRCRVRRSWAERSESWFRSGHSAKPDAPKIAAPPGQGITINDGGSWPPDAVFSHCPACREAGVRKVRSGARPNCEGRSYGHNGATTYGDLEGHAYKALPVNPDGTETVPAWECLAACTCGLASLSPAGGAPERCPGCGEERWWACPVAELDGQSGELQTDKHKPGREYGKGNQFMTRGEGVVKMPRGEWNPHPGGGGASRFFPTFHYDAKASARERQAGCEGLLWVKDKAAPIGWRRVNAAEHAAASEKDRAQGNVHATIKPIGCGADDGFMRWAVRLVTPVGGRVGDPFLGSGSTAVACQIEGHDFTGCDIDPGAVDIARVRTAFWTPKQHRLALRGAPKKRQEAALVAQADLFAPPAA